MLGLGISARLGIGGVLVVVLTCRHPHHSLLPGSHLPNLVNRMIVGIRTLKLHRMKYLCANFLSISLLLNSSHGLQHNKMTITIEKPNLKTILSYSHLNKHNKDVCTRLDPFIPGDILSRHDISLPLHDLLSCQAFSLKI